MVTADSEQSLFTLSFPMDERLLGRVYVYPQPEQFPSAWNRLPRPKGKDAMQPVASLQTAARAVTGERLVFTDPNRPAFTGPWAKRTLLITHSPLDPTTVGNLVREWEARIPGHERHDTLAPLLDFHAGGPYALTDILQRDAQGRITGPYWAFRVAGWQLANLLATQPMPIEDQLPEPLPFLLDSDGDLLAWQSPLTHEKTWTDEDSGKRRRIVGYAMERIHIEVEPAPGGRILVAHLSARISRVANHWKGIRNALVRHAVNPDVILKAPIRTRWEKGPDGLMQPKSVDYHGATAQIVEACGIAPLPEPPTNLDELGDVRGVHRTGKHPIEKGAGAMFLAKLEEHATWVFDQAPVTYQASSIRISKSTADFRPYVPADKILPALDSADIAALRAVVVYESTEWKRRVLGQLARDYSLPALADLADEKPLQITPGFELIAMHLPELVRHGDQNRALILNSLRCFTRSTERDLVTALCETRYLTEQEKEDRVTDAKHALKALFAERGIPSQFITMDSDPGDPYRMNMRDRVERSKARKAGLPDPVVDYKDDNAVQIALGSLQSDSGIIDNRLAAAAFHRNAKDTALDREAVAVGLWTRLHRFEETAGRPKRAAVLAVTLVAMRITPGDDEYWPTLMYSDQGWQRLAPARALHHAGPIGKKGHHLRKEQQGPDNVNNYVNRALAALTQRYPLIIFTEQRKGLWPGLANERLGDPRIPGQQLIAQGWDISVVRVGNGQGTPQPSRRIGGGGKLPKNPEQPVMPEKILYHSDHGGVRSYLFAGQSRQHAGGQRTGTQHTRRTLPSGQLAQMSAPFHAMTRSEYVVAHPGTWREEQLTGLAARISEQAAMWDGRTNLPAPLHLAKSADEKHPGFRDQEGLND